MGMRKVVGAIGIISLLTLGLHSAAFAQSSKATPQDILQKVHEAASALTKSGGSDLSQFDNPKGPWVFKDTYVYVLNCKKGTVAAHPFVPKLIGSNIFAEHDVKGNYMGPQACQAAKKPEGGWIEYWFPKPHQKQASRKVAFAYHASGTPFVAVAGMYSENLTVAKLDNMTKK